MRILFGWRTNTWIKKADLNIIQRIFLLFLRIWVHIPFLDFVNCMVFSDSWGGIQKRQIVFLCGLNVSRVVTLIFDSKPTSVLCHMGNFGRGGGGWMPVMKIDGNKV